MGFFQNTAKLEGLGGKLMVKGMNLGSHAKLAEWGFSFLVGIGAGSKVLDAGCGGGANVERWLERCADGKVVGLDYSEVSVAESLKVNDAAIRARRCEIVQGNVAEMPFPGGSFDCVSAFETVYFWPDLSETFREVFRVLKDGGVFLICNESNGHDEAAQKWARKIEGMRLYDADMLEGCLRSAGFAGVSVHERPEKNWLCVTAGKGFTDNQVARI